MTAGRFAPRALRELRDAAAWIAEDNPAAAEALLQAAVRAADMIAGRPGMGHVRLALAPERFRFWPLRGFPYLLVWGFLCQRVSCDFLLTGRHGISRRSSLWTDGAASHILSPARSLGAAPRLPVPTDRIRV